MIHARRFSCWVLSALLIALFAPFPASAQSQWMPVPAHIRVVIGSGGNYRAPSGREIDGGINIFGGEPVQGDTLTLESNVWAGLGQDRTTGVELTSTVGTHMLSAAPNPFREQTSIVLRAPALADPVVIIYNLYGERVRTLTPSNHSDGAAMHRWDGRDDAGREVPSGAYLCIVAARASEHSRSTIANARLLLRRVR